MKNSPEDNNSIVLLMTYPRTGGTLLSKILRNHSKVCLVSEVHPNYNSLFPLSDQIEKWFGLESVDDYCKDLDTFIKHAREKGQTPVIRDFSFADFVDHSSSEPKRPTNLEILQNKGHNVIKIGLIRNAYDVWLSQKTPKDFGVKYLAYCRTLVENDFYVIKYEEVCNNPQKTIEKVIEQLYLENEKGLTDNLKSSEYITGDISEDYNSRAFNSEEIECLKRRSIPLSKIKQAKGDEQMKEANKLFDYEINIFEGDFDNKKLKFR